jgi:hypothetical protein
MLPLPLLASFALADVPADPRLADPATWCDAADALVAAGDANALVPILATYEAHPESDRLCLLRAMKTLAEGDHVLVLLAEGTHTRTALRVMELAPDPRWLVPLEEAVEAPALEKAALAALVAQVRTPQWEAVMIRALDARSRAVRAEAIRVLAGRKNARAALAARLAHEPDAELKAAIEAAVRD